MIDRVSLARVLGCALLLVVALRGQAAETNGVAFEPKPGDQWQCELSNADFPGLAAEGMTQPLASGCEKGKARAYVVIVDLSDSRSAMSADQMAADAEEQLPGTWKIDSKVYDVISLGDGRRAAYSRLIGKGDGFTFVSGQTSMVAISANVPLIFEDDNHVPHQAIAVFRVRAPLPVGAAARKELVEELDRTLRGWAATAKPARGAAISERDFEAAAYTRTKNAIAPAPASNPQPSRTETSSIEGVATALVAAANGIATADDLNVLENAERRYPHDPLSTVARSYLDDAHRVVQTQQQRQILAVALEKAGERGPDVLSRFMLVAVNDADATALAAEIEIARGHGWTLRNMNASTVTALALSIVNRKVTLPPAPEVRAFFELSSAELLPFVQNVVAVPFIDQIARPARDAWQLRERRQAPVPAVLVRRENGVGVLEIQPGRRVYRYRALTNLLDMTLPKP
jgi:hypothetical protein